MLNNVEFYKFIIAIEQTTQAFNEFSEIFNSIKNRYNPVVWFIIRLVNEI